MNDVKDHLLELILLVAYILLSTICHVMTLKTVVSGAGDSKEKLTEETMQVLSPSDRAISLSCERMNSLQADNGNLISTESNATEGDDPARISGGIDSLDKFLPPPPTTKCSQELQVGYFYFK